MKAFTTAGVAGTPLYSFTVAWMPGPLPKTISEMPSGLDDVSVFPENVPMSAVATITPLRYAAPNGWTCRIADELTPTPGFTVNTRARPPRSWPARISVVPSPVIDPTAISTPPR